MGKTTEKGFNDFAKKEKASAHENNIVNEMMKDIMNYFNKENNYELTRK